MHTATMMTGSLVLDGVNLNLVQCTGT